MCGISLTSATADTPGGEMNSDDSPPRNPTATKIAITTTRARTNW